MDGLFSIIGVVFVVLIIAGLLAFQFGGLTITKRDTRTGKEKTYGKTDDK